MHNPPIVANPSPKRPVRSPPLALPQPMMAEPTMLNTTLTTISRPTRHPSSGETRAIQTGDRPNSTTLLAMEV